MPVSPLDQKLCRREIITLTIAGITAGCSAPMSKPNPTNSRPAWPMYGYNASRTSYKPITKQPEAPVEVKWKTKTNGDFLASPVVAGELIYIGGQKGRFQAIDPRTGKEHWHLIVEGAINVPPAFANGTVFVGTTDGQLYALDAAGGFNILGKRFNAYRWSTKLDGSILSPPAVIDGSVYVATVDGTLTALNSSTGRIQWKYSGGGKQFSTPAIGSKRIYYNRPDVKDHLVALSRKKGEELWSFKHGRDNDSTFSTPAVTGNQVILGSSDSRIYGLDTETGIEKWVLNTSAPIVSSPAITDTQVFIGNMDGQLYALNRTPERDNGTFQLAAVSEQV